MYIMIYFCHLHVYYINCSLEHMRKTKMLNLESKCTSESQFSSMAFSFRFWNLTPRIFEQDFNSRTWKFLERLLSLRLITENYVTLQAKFQMISLFNNWCPPPLVFYIKFLTYIGTVDSPMYGIFFGWVIAVFSMLAWYAKE